jgi:PAS domain S-box-containing protein
MYTDITERKRTEESLEKNEKLLKSVLDNVNSGVALIDETGRFTVYNPLFLKLFGLSEDTTVKNINDQNWADWQVFNEDGTLLHIDDHPVRKAALTGKRIEHQLVGVKLPTGEEITWMLISAEPILKENGEVEKIICTYHDITERKKIEGDRLRLLTEVENQAAELDATISSMATGLIIYNTEGKAIRMNNTAKELLPSEIFFNRTVDERNKVLQWKTEDGQICPPENIPVARALHGETTNDVVLVAQLTDRKLWISASASPINSSDGRMLGVVASFIDITPRKQFEAALKDSEERFRTIAETVPALVCITRSEDSIVMFTNEYNNKAFGINGEDIVGTKGPDYYCDPADRQKMVNLFKEKGTVDNFQLKVKKSDGTPFWIITSVRPIIYQGYQAMIGASIDITDYKKVEEALQESEEKYKELVTNARGLIFNQDTKGKFTFVNDYAIEFFGYKEEELIGKTAIETITPPIDSTGRNLVEMVDNIYSDPNEYSININENIKKNGERVWIEWHNKAITDINGNRSGHIAIGFDITERIQAEKALLESEQKLKFHFENSPLAVVEWDADFIVTQWSREAEHIFGWMKEETLGKRIDTLNMIYDEDIPIVNHTMERLTSGQETMVVSTNRNLTKSGEVIECTWYNSILTDEKGQMKSVMSLVQDITERKKSEQEISESRAKLDAALASMTDAIFISDAKGNFIEFNDAFAVYHRFKNKAECSRSIYSCPDILDVFMADGTPAQLDMWAVPRALRGETVTNAEYTLRRKDTGETWVGSYSFAPIRDKDGVINGSVVVARDITEIKQAEIKLKETQEKLNIALENGNIGVWEWNMKNDKVTWDERMEKMFGLLPGSFGGSYKDFEILLNDEDMPHVQNAINKALMHNLPYETIFRTKSNDGKTKYISAKALVNKDINDIPISMTGVCFDVTAMKEGTQQLELKLNEELLRSNKELESFAYVASHDLQEPLRTVSSFTQLLAKKYQDQLDDNAKEYIRFVVDGANRMYDLINGLLAFSRVNTRGGEFSETNMSIIVEKVRKNLEYQILDKNIHIVVEALPSVIADEGQMLQLIQNLVGNAIKFSYDNSQIQISSLQEGDSIIFSVKDDGIGIEPQYFERIFQIFQRLHTREDYPGTGIGLSICKRIVERHGGSIWLESELGKGSTFFFSLPKNA